MRMVFACQRKGLSDTLKQGLLGGYDGAGRWQMYLSELRGSDEQLMVESHEGLHHELQAATPYGRMAAMAAMLAKEEFRHDDLVEFFEASVQYSRTTHETFATTQSAAAVGLAEARTLLADNPDYLDHLERGVRLAGRPPLPWWFRESIAAAVLRCCMAPAELFDLLDRGFGQIRHAHLRRFASPDSRLKAFIEHTDPDGWHTLLSDLVAEYPERDMAKGDENRREIPADLNGVEELRRFEEEIVLRRCYEYAANVLETVGMNTVSWADGPKIAEALIEAVGAASPTLAARLQLVVERRPVLDDGLEYDRQNIVLRAPLRLELLEERHTPRLVAQFVQGVGPSEHHVCGVWLSRESVLRQFSTAATLPDLVVGLLAVARASDEEELALIGLLSPTTTPSECQALLGETPLVALSSHSTLSVPSAIDLLSAVEPVFVLMDLPIAAQIRDWVEHDSEIRMSLIPLEGVGATDLLMAVFVTSLAPGMRFIAIGGRTGMSVLADQLRRRHEEHLIMGGTLDDEDIARLNRLLSMIFALWHTIGQDAVP